MSKKTSSNANELLRMWLRFQMAVAFLVIIARHDGSESAAMNSDAVCLLIALVIFEIPTLLLSTLLCFSNKKRAANGTQRQRPTLWHVTYFMLRYVPLILLLSLSFGYYWSFESIGFSPTPFWALNVVVGIAAAITFLSMRVGVHRLRPRQPNEGAEFIDTELLHTHLPRGNTAQKLNVFVAVFYSPLIEELTYRGFFVYFLGNILGSQVAGIAIGFLFCVWMHAYMGPSRLWSVVTFYFTAIALLFSPFGLLSVIAFHSVCNAAYLIQTQVQVKQFVGHTQERSMRQNRRINKN